MDDVAVLTGVVLFLGISTSITIGKLRNDVARINKTLDKIAKQMGVPDDTEAEILEEEIK